jgi:heme/copper-type cytochrome/quinol oxidase subunit 4
MTGETGKFIIVIGVCIVVAGIIIWLFHDKLQWIGRLPGDIRMERPNFNFYFPITTMIIVSIVVTGIIWLVRRFL